MSAAFRDGILQQINQMESELKSLRAALTAYDNAQPRILADSPETRFRGIAPLKAIRTLLKDNGGRMNRDAIIELLVAGGANIGKKRGNHNLRISIEVNIGNGNLIADGNDIVLPPD
jgi:hypothetical protein